MVGADVDRLEGGQGKGGSNGRRSGGGGGAGGAGGAGFDGLGLGARSNHTGGGARAAPGRRLPWEQAAPVERSGAGRRIDLSVRDPKSIDQVVTLKSIKVHSLKSNIAAALGLKLDHPIMSKLWGLGDQTYRQNRCSKQVYVHGFYYESITIDK